MTTQKITSTLNKSGFKGFSDVAERCRTTKVSHNVPTLGVRCPIKKRKL